MHHGLLVARLVVRHETGGVDGQLRERLPDPRDVAVTEDAERAGDRALPVVAVDGPLVGEELDERLPDRHPARGAVCEVMVTPS